MIATSGGARKRSKGWRRLRTITSTDVWLAFLLWHIPVEVYIYIHSRRSRAAGEHRVYVILDWLKLDQGQILILSLLKR